jgi:chemotaxis family two-component system response regulator Rcp1
LIEDNRADVYLIRQAIRAAQIEADLYVLHDGHAATKFFDAADSDDNAPCVDLILLDLNLPKKSGEDVLHHLRKSKRCRNAIVLIVTSSDSARDREAAAVLTVSAYFRKPSEYAEFMKLGSVVGQLLSQAKSEGAG